MIHYRYLCRIFERKCFFDDVFSLFEVDQVNVKYVSRATQPRFFVNYITNTNQIDENRMQYQGLDNYRAKFVSNSILCVDKRNLHQQNPSGGVSYAPFRHFVLLKKYIVYGQGPIACKPLEDYRFYCMALYHSQTRRHIIMYIPINDTSFELFVFRPSDTESRINEMRFSDSISLSFKTRLTSVTCFYGNVT